MNKIRVHELSKKLEISSKVLLAKLEELGIEAKSHMSSLEEKDAKIVIELFEKKIKKTSPVKEKQIPAAPEPELKKPEKATPKHKAEISKAISEKIQEIEIPKIISIGEFAQKINVSATEIIKFLMKQGLMLNINQNVDFSKAKEIADSFGLKIALAACEQTKEKTLTIVKGKNLVSRPPVVTVMGHVDHGKTSLLDAIRKTNVVSGENGGITQKIGAYKVEFEGKEIIFIDTPGHEAFTSMRAKGAKVTDIVLLIIAADDGVMPQTIEAINHAKAAKVPMICVINKIDKPHSNPDKIKQQLSDLGILPEEWGGDTICINISAKQKTGISELLEMILLVSEMQEFKASPDRPAQGTIIEAKLDKGLGPVATVLIQNGTLNIGDVVIAGKTFGKIRAMINDRGEKLVKATPSTPVGIIGLNEVPQAGDIIEISLDEKTTRQIVGERILKSKEETSSTQKTNLEDLLKQTGDGEFRELNLIIRADDRGSIEAIKQALLKLKNEAIGINIIHTGVGTITESDILLATASKSIIVGFNIKPDSNIVKLALQENIDIRTYRVIYNAIEDIKLAMKGLLKPKYKEVLLGKAEVRQIFKVPKIGVVAGTYVTEGKIMRGSDARVLRDGVIIYEGKISSLRRFKDDVKEVAEDFECGIGIEKFGNIQPKDIIEAYTLQEIAPTSSF